MNNVDDARDKCVTGDNDKLEEEIAGAAKNECKSSDDVDASIDDGIDPAVFFDGSIKRA